MCTKICSCASYYYNRTTTNLLIAPGLKGKWARGAKAALLTVQSVFSGTRKCFSNVRNDPHPLSYIARSLSDTQRGMEVILGASAYLVSYVPSVINALVAPTPEQNCADQEEDTALSNKMAGMALGMVAVTLNYQIRKRFFCNAPTTPQEVLLDASMGLLTASVLGDGTNIALSYLMAEQTAKKIASTVVFSATVVTLKWDVLRHAAIVDRGGGEHQLRQTQRLLLSDLASIALSELASSISLPVKIGFLTMGAATVANIKYDSPSLLDSINEVADDIHTKSRGTISTFHLITVPEYGLVASTALFPGLLGTALTTGVIGQMAEIGHGNPPRWLDELSWCYTNNFWIANHDKKPHARAKFRFLEERNLVLARLKDSTLNELRIFPRGTARLNGPYTPAPWLQVVDYVGRDRNYYQEALDAERLQLRKEEEALNREALNFISPY